MRGFLERVFLWVRYLAASLCVLVLSGVASTVWAHGGEDHTHDAPTAAVETGTGMHKLEATSEQVELLGVFNNGVLTLYVDDFATNAPIAGLKIEISADANSARAVERSAGYYEATLPWIKDPGHYPLTFLLEGDAVTDLLQATLDTVVPGVAETPLTENRMQVLGWAGGIGGALLLIFTLLRFRRGGVVALCMAAALCFWPESPVLAHGGEEHSHDDAVAPVVTGDAPRRLPDGRVFIPKATQHLLQVRTLLATEETSVRRVTLNGRVIADPGASGVVQAAQAGRIEAAKQGFPVLGQHVKAGQVLAWLSPVTTSLERGNQLASLSRIESEWKIAEQRRTRLEALVGSIPQKDIDAARINADSLRQRRDAVAASLQQKEPLKAPVTGIISASDAVVGQVVSAGDLLFTVVQPDRLWVEALSYDPALVLGDTPAVAKAGAVSVRLTRVGSGAALRDQSIPLHFRIEPPVPPMPVGQPVTVLVSTQTPSQGVPVPVDALARNAQGEWVVWLHEKAELFRPVVVQSEPLDGARVMITRGIAAGARVVSSGAASLGQIR